MKLRTLIVDDEAPARERLQNLLAGNELIELVGEAKDGVEAVQMIERTAPDLVFLDIQMPVLDGFGAIESLEEPPAIIFVTAYDEYAIRAFEVNALDYLLKPFSRERLERAVQRAHEELSTGHGFAGKIGPLLESLREEKQYMERIAVRKVDHILVFDVAEIDWIDAEHGRVVVHVGDEAHRVSRTLTQLEDRLDPLLFFRAHRSVIVNLGRVKEIIPWFAGSHKLRLTTGAEVDLSRSRAKALRGRTTPKGVRRSESGEWHQLHGGGRGGVWLPGAEWSG
jgi:two-component system LytT family response regulator